MGRAEITRPVTQPGEEGYVLVAVIFLLAILVLTMAVAAPMVRKDLQRDREVETMERGLQYKRAIQLYYRKFQSYPPNIDALVMTNQIRFLRKRYKDPMTGKDDWKPIMYGQNKAPLALGFFGQPLAGSMLAGTGPSGGNGINGATPAGGAFGGSSFSGSSFSGGGSIFGSDNGTGQTGTPATPGTPGATGTTGTGTDTGPGSSSSSSGLLSGATFGGGGIIGFEPGATGQSILLYKKKDHYNEWEFTYSPLADTSMGAGAAGAMGGAMNNAFGSGSQSSNTDIFGGSGSGTGNTPTPTPTPTSPTSPTPQ